MVSFSLPPLLHKLTPLAFSFCALVLCYTLINGCVARDTMYLGGTKLEESKGETLVSAAGRFELGFFSGNSTRGSRYLGIWYKNLSPRIVVWVANRDRPLHNSTGTLAFGPDGSLQVLDESGELYWSTAADRQVRIRRRYAEARLMDSGNFVLSTPLETIWQSFENLVDTLLPGMNITQISLNSWRAEGNPGSGRFNFSETVQNQFVIQFQPEIVPQWRSTFETGLFKGARQNLISDILANVTTSQASDDTNWRLVMNSTGEIQYWILEAQQWILKSWAPRDRCGFGNVCGSFGICNVKNRIMCKCLTGFAPIYPKLWARRAFTDGCKRDEVIGTTNDSFLALSKMRVGNFDLSISADGGKCREQCLNTPQCQAYTQENKSAQSDQACLIWTEDLNYLQEGYDGGANKLFVRVAISSTSSGKDASASLIVGASIGGVVVLLSCSILCCWLFRRKLTKRREGRGKFQYEVLMHNTEERIKQLIENQHFTEEDGKGIDVQSVDFDSILAATDNFSNTNKLGQGGFGPVYKGNFPGGEEVAIKRLSSTSGQGLVEFKNEVVLIGRLQHRNLVRLLGYCLKGDEKILLYEYMRNKSLDLFLFDSQHSALLTWEKRFDIILGVSRGLLYLHQDSRFRIIHRDLKTSNILLDEEMNPKISDFGLATILVGKQNEGGTERMMGTFGYMAPEYMIDELFSVKTDVFSFGVVVLEILSGKKTTDFNLLDDAWRLWKKGKTMEFMAGTLGESCKRKEFLKCVNVALLCIEENPEDRPTMSSVLVFLSSETAIPAPKKPAFTRGSQHSLEPGSASSSKQEA